MCGPRPVAFLHPLRGSPSEQPHHLISFSEMNLPRWEWAENKHMATWDGHGYGYPPLQQAMLILDRRGSGLSKFEETKLQIRNLDHRLFIHSLTLIRVTDRLHFQMAYPS